MIKEKIPIPFRRSRIYNFLVSIFVGEVRWFRKLRNHLTKKSLPKRYKSWIVENEEDLAFQVDERRTASKEAEKIFLVLYRIDGGSIDKIYDIIQSLQSQAHSRWFLQIAVDQSTVDGWGNDLLRLHDHDERVRIWSPQDETIERRSLGEWLGGLDFDYLILPHERNILHYQALSELERWFDSNPESKIVYGDEDKINPQGVRHSPWFKPDWSPELLISTNFLEPIVIRNDIVMDIDDFWSAFHRGRHWKKILDFLIAYDGKISHLPKILSHARSVSSAWDYAHETVQEHLEWVRQFLQGRGLSQVEVALDPVDQIKVSWSNSDPLVSVIIPTKEKIEVLHRCLETLTNITRYANFEIVVVDTGSTSKAVWHAYDEFGSDPRISVFSHDGSFNYSSANNLGVSHSKGDILLFLNNDVEIINEDWLEEMVRWVQLSDIGVVGAKLLYPDLMIQHVGVVLGLGGHAGHILIGADEHEFGLFGSVDWYRNYHAVTGACMMVRRKVFEEVGGFDIRYEVVFGDVDLCIRIVQEGYRVMVTPHAKLIHHAGSTRRRFNPKSDLVRGYQLLLPYLETGDTFYNPNLSYSDPYPRLAARDERSRVDRVRRIVGDGIRI